MRHMRLLLGIGLATLLGCQATTRYRTTSRHIDDRAITAAVTSNLIASGEVNFVRVDVETERGVVYLTGVVATQDHKQRAEQEARRVDGVVGVENHLQVQSVP